MAWALGCRPRRAALLTASQTAAISLSHRLTKKCGHHGLATHWTSVFLFFGAFAICAVSAEERSLEVRGTARSLQYSPPIPPAPSLDVEENVLFSQVEARTSSTVVYFVVAIYVGCALLLVVAVNLDYAERHFRRQRALVPEESVPCQLVEQYNLTEQTAMLRRQEWPYRKKRMRLCDFALERLTEFLEHLTRQHTLLSFTARAIPSFTRLKRAYVMIVHLHICMLTAALTLNVLEFEKPQGKYEIFSCDGQPVTSNCTATLPWSVLSALVLYPIFRFLVHRQVRFSCCGSQGHPRSKGTLDVRKFASVPAKSVWEAVCCMRSLRERREAEVLACRSRAHRVVTFLSRATNASIDDLRFHDVAVSWCVITVNFVTVTFTLFYVLCFTAYLSDTVVYHWAAWVLVMFSSATFVLEPVSVFWWSVVWSTVVSTLAQRWGIGVFAQTCDHRWRDVDRRFASTFLRKARLCAVTRVQRWWRAVLDLNAMMDEQQHAAVRIQALGRKAKQQKLYTMERRWCLKVTVLDCEELAPVELMDVMSPFVRLQCDVGNPYVRRTDVHWDSGNTAVFNETFFFDVKEARKLYVSAWSQGLMSEEFVGRAFIDIENLKRNTGKVGLSDVQLTLRDIVHGDSCAGSGGMSSSRGRVNLQVSLLDPLKDACGGEGNDWMMPKHRMQLALSQVGGHVRLGRVLGSLPATAREETPVQQSKLPPSPLRPEERMTDQGLHHVERARSESSAPSSYASGYFGVSDQTLPSVIPPNNCLRQPEPPRGNPQSLGVGRVHSPTHHSKSVVVHEEDASPRVPSRSRAGGVQPVGGIDGFGRGPTLVSAGAPPLSVNLDFAAQHDPGCQPNTRNVGTSNKTCPVQLEFEALSLNPTGATTWRRPPPVPGVVQIESPNSHSHLQIR